MSENKRFSSEKSALPGEGFPLPDAVVLQEILPRLEHAPLLSVASVCRNLRSAVAQTLPNLTSLDLSALSPNGELLGHIVPRLIGLKSVTIDCLRLEDHSFIDILGPHIEELNLLKCTSLSSEVLASIGNKYPNLRILVIELAGDGFFGYVRKDLIKMLERCDNLEHLSINVRGTERFDTFHFASIGRFLPKTLKLLKLQPVNEHDATRFFERLREERKKSAPPPYLSLNGFTVLRLSLVLNVISDRLISSIATALPNLIELNLEDRPFIEPSFLNDLTSSGMQFLHSCQHLRHLSLVRSRVNCQVSFKFFDDMGLMLLSQSCLMLESLKLGGFSRVTDAGFSSLLRTCHNLKKYEIRRAPLLSDLAFHNIDGVVCPLVELRLQYCNLITSEAVAELASSSALEVLDTNGCRSIADPCLKYISRIRTLTSLNIGGSDITDSGLRVLSKGNLPITNLSLRGCARVTDRGIISLIKGGERIMKMLISLDVGYMPGVSDKAIHAIVSSCEAITELCMRYCFHVTDAAFVTLASGKFGTTKHIEKLDVCHCTGLSEGVVELFDLFQRPTFRGLRWLGIEGTKLLKRKDFEVICRRRPWLTVCHEGCELGCHDGWQFQ